jgi:hypothetical protein
MACMQLNIYVKYTLIHYNVASIKVWQLILNQPKKITNPRCLKYSTNEGEKQIYTDGMGELPLGTKRLKMGRNGGLNGPISTAAARWEKEWGRGGRRKVVMLLSGSRGHTNPFRTTSCLRRDHRPMWWFLTRPFGHAVCSGTIGSTWRHVSRQPHFHVPRCQWVAPRSSVRPSSKLRQYVRHG